MNLNKIPYTYSLFSIKLLKQVPNFVKKYNFLAELLIVEYR